MTTYTAPTYRMPLDITKALRANEAEILTVPVCTTCGIPVRVTMHGPVHAEPRTLANRLHNGTPDHNATL